MDLHLKPSSVKSKKLYIARMMREVGPDPTTEELRDFLAAFENPSSYNNCIKALRLYFRDFLGDYDRVRTFKFCRVDYGPVRLYSVRELREFYSALDTERDRALFLLYATSGRRRTEVLDLRLSDLRLEDRVIMPVHSSATKKTWYSFFNEEAKAALEEYLNVRQDPKRSGRLFPMAWAEKSCLFRIAMEKTGLHITPQTLRFWFANEMARLGVPDRFIDAFQGRIPRSVLARHYTDYSLENLKAIYDRAGLKVLS
ncbi:MAG: tyrosine-type recombinase/integrase [Candidatus Methanosuratus sp.]|nr:tyrosine-type recombinase/integrase [Candidatus Methanosuratincola sp.]